MRTYQGFMIEGAPRKRAWRAAYTVRNAAGLLAWTAVRYQHANGYPAVAANVVVLGTLQEVRAWVDQGFPAQTANGRVVWAATQEEAEARG